MFFSNNIWVYVIKKWGRRTARAQKNIILKMTFKIVLNLILKMICNKKREIHFESDCEHYFENIFGIILNILKKTFFEMRWCVGFVPYRCVYVRWFCALPVRVCPCLLCPTGAVFF